MFVMHSGIHITLNKKAETSIEVSASVPRTGLEPARLAALAPETSASTIPPPGLLWCKDNAFIRFINYAGQIIFSNSVAFMSRQAYNLSLLAEIMQCEIKVLTLQQIGVMYRPGFTIIRQSST